MHAPRHQTHRLSRGSSLKLKAEQQQRQLIPTHPLHPTAHKQCARPAATTAGARGEAPSSSWRPPQQQHVSSCQVQVSAPPTHSNPRPRMFPTHPPTTPTPPTPTQPAAFHAPRPPPHSSSSRLSRSPSRSSLLHSPKKPLLLPHAHQLPLAALTIQPAAVKTSLTAVLRLIGR